MASKGLLGAKPTAPPIKRSNVSIGLAMSPAFEAVLAQAGAAAEHPIRLARTPAEVLALLDGAPRAIVLDAEDEATPEVLRRLAKSSREDATLAICVTRHVTGDVVPGAHVVVAQAVLEQALEAAGRSEAGPVVDVDRLLVLSVLNGPLDQALEQAADEIAVSFGVDRCVISIRGDSTGGAASGANTWDSFAWNRTADRCRAASAVGATLIAPSEPAGSSESYLAVPLENPLGTYGFVGLLADRPVVFSREQRNALAAVAARLSMELGWRAVHQKTTEELDRLGNAPGHDLLLGMWNRVGIAELAAMYVSASKRSTLPFAIAMVDVVDLAGINTRYGHEIGDRVLRRIADAIRTTIRAEDVVGRWAGDKIAVLLHGTMVEGAQRVAERFGAAFDARPVELPGGERVALPATVGIAALGPNEDAMTLMTRALHACRAAREGGLPVARASTSPLPRISAQHLDLEELRATVGGTYRLQHEISRGGMGVVYRAEDLALERPVAIKMLRPDLAEDREFVEQLRFEAAMLARLQHPHLVQIYSFGQSGSDSYFVMELVEGESLQQAIERHHLERTSVPLSQLLAIVEEIASALDALHDRGIVHRDVKPANVIRDPFRNRAVLVDVGIARKYGQFAEAAGTPGYVAPEVIAGREATPRSDVYGLAATAYALLTLTSPFGDDGDVIARQTSGAPVTPPSALRPDLAAVDGPLVAALAADPQLRPASAGQLARALRECLPIDDGAPKPVARGHLIMPRRANRNTRGVVFRSVARALGLREMQRLRDGIGGTHPEITAALTDTAPLAWIPSELFSELLVIAPPHVDREATRLARDVARATVRASFRRFFPASAATLVPERTLSAIRSVWSQYQSWGTVSSMPVNASETVVRIADPIHDANLCAWTEGLLEQLVVLSGARAPTVDHEECVTRGDTACLFRATWKGPT